MTGSGPAMGIATTTLPQLLKQSRWPTAFYRFILLLKRSKETVRQTRSQVGVECTSGSIPWCPTPPILSLPNLAFWKTSHYVLLAC